MKRVGLLEKRYINQVLRSEFRSSRATGMTSFAEKEFASKIGTEFALGFVNGTATLHAALEAIGIGPGDEVIVPPLTMSATSIAVLQANATPVFADVDISTWQIDPNSIKSKITNRTKAIITVALYGGSPDYYSITSSAPGIPIIEDNAEAFGTTYHGKQIGSFGIFSSYSFQSSKQLSAGEGGMLCTNSLAYADRVRKLQTLGYSAVGAYQQRIEKNVIQDPNYSRHEVLGWNYRMSDLTAAVVRAQTERGESLLAIRRRAGEAIFEMAEKSHGLLTPQSKYENSTHSFWSAAVTIDTSKFGWHEFRDSFQNFGGKGIYAAWQLTYHEPFFRNANFLGREKFIKPEILDSYSQNLCPNAEIIQPRVLAFRTNEWTKTALKKQIKALESTIKHFKSRD